MTFPGKRIGRVHKLEIRGGSIYFCPKPGFRNFHIQKPTSVGLSIFPEKFDYNKNRKTG